MSKQQGDTCLTIRAIITKVVEEDGYIVTVPLIGQGDLTTNDSVTFSRADWQGERKPKVGQQVELRDTTLYRKGWRASEATPLHP